GAVESKEDVISLDARLRGRSILDDFHGDQALLIGKLELGPQSWLEGRDRDADPVSGRLRVDRTEADLDPRLDFERDLLAAAEEEQGDGLIAGGPQARLQVLGLAE